LLLQYQYHNLIIQTNILLYPTSGLFLQIYNIRSINDEQMLLALGWRKAITLLKRELYLTLHDIEKVYKCVVAIGTSLITCSGSKLG
jgi:hypothetical protein